MDERLIARFILCITLCTAAFILACLSTAIIPLWELTTRRKARKTSRLPLSIEHSSPMNNEGEQSWYDF
jgi:hypothetical protein